MLSKVDARRIRDLYNAETKASAPAPLTPVAPGDAPAAPLANPPFDLLAAHSYSGFSPSCRPFYQQVEAVGKRIKSTGFPVPWIGCRQLAFVKPDWDPASVPTVL